MTGHELSLLKDLITRKFISIRLPYARHTQNLPHWASFAGTCNYPQVLYDPTGNRRFLCYEIEKIDRLEIDYPQLMPRSSICWTVVTATGSKPMRTMR